MKGKDEHLLAMEMNAFLTGDEAVKTCIQTSATHTHTASYQRLPNKPYVEMITAHLQKRAASCSRTHLLVFQLIWKWKLADISNHQHLKSGMHMYMNLQLVYSKQKI